MSAIPVSSVLDSNRDDLYDVATHAAGPAGALPITAEMLVAQPSGNLFGLSQNAGMGWEPSRLLDPEFLILSTHGGLRAEDGSPIALGFHTGHWEVGLLVQEAARELKRLGAIPFAGACTDPCDGRTQGTVGMLDSLPYRNDAAIVLRRLIRSLPRRRGVMGIATCDKGLPAMMMALSGQRVWLDMATRSARALLNLDARQITTSHIITEASIRNAMIIHAAFGGSTNLLLHIPAIAHAAGLPRPTVQEWAEINRKTP